MRLFLLGQAKADAAPEYVALARPEGRAQRRVSGVYLGTIPDYVQEGENGVALSGVVKGGPAQLAGLRGGDRVIGLAGEDLINIYDLVRVLNGLKPDEAVEIVVQRGEETLNLDVTPRLRD